MPESFFLLFSVNAVMSELLTKDVALRSLLKLINEQSVFAWEGVMSDDTTRLEEYHVVMFNVLQSCQCNMNSWQVPIELL